VFHGKEENYFIKKHYNFMGRKATPTVSIIAMVIVAFFVVFLAVKQYFALRQQIYVEAYYGFDK